MSALKPMKMMLACLHRPFTLLPSRSGNAYFNIRCHHGLDKRCKPYRWSDPRKLDNFRWQYRWDEQSRWFVDERCECK